MTGKRIYPRLSAVMAVRGVTVTGLADQIGIHYETMRRKMRGERDFSLDEAVRIKALLRFGGALETLFEKQDQRKKDTNGQR